MLRNFEAVNIFKSYDSDPSISEQEKLAIIADSPVQILPSKYSGLFSATLPFVKGAGLYVFNDSSSYSSTVTIDYFNLGDASLTGKGIGTRILRSALAHACRIQPNVEFMHAQGARLGTLNTILGICGKENVKVVKATGEYEYGEGTGRAIDSIFDDFPFVAGEDYVAGTIDARIPIDHVRNWELPSVAIST